MDGSTHIDSVKTKFIIVGLFMLIHGLIGAYGFVSRQSRSLLLYGCLGLCLLIVGSISAWTALHDKEKIMKESKYYFYQQWQDYTKRIDEDADGDTPVPYEGMEIHEKKDQFIWNIICVQKFCHMRYIPPTLEDDLTETEREQKLDELEEQHYYICKYDQFKKSFCDETNNCDTKCDIHAPTYDEGVCKSICTERREPFTCIKYVKQLTKNRVVTMYVTLFCLSVTQTVCLVCNIFFIFWSLKEEVDKECHLHEQMGLEHKGYSTKLRLLARFLPCCFHLPKSSDFEARAEDAPPPNALALSDIFSASEGEDPSVVQMPPLGAAGRDNEVDL